ncbi:MAG TPA: phage tail tip lysozyme [Polyangia bacterium]|nr:phage tail tip lysozyme [Polyangia bacterium]
MRKPTLFVLAFAFAATGCVAQDDVSMSEAALSSSEHTAFNFFVSKGLTKFQAAGIVGNLVQESGVNPGSVQFGGGPGRGIAQWSVGGRWDRDHDDNVAWYASAHGESRWALNTQLAFTWYELESFGGYGLAALRSSGSLRDATIIFQDRFEGCGQCDESRRIQYAEQALSAYGGGASSGGGAGCYSHTLGREMPDNACVQSRSDNLWYQCANGSWVDRWTDPAACNGVHPL